MFTLIPALVLIGFVLIALAPLWTDVYERTTGVLLVGHAPLAVGAMLTDNWVSAGLGATIATVLLGIGYSHVPDEEP